MPALAEMETTRPRKTHQSEPLLAHPLPAVYHLRDGRSNGGQPLRDRHGRPHDFLLGPRVLRLHLLAQAEVVPAGLLQRHHVPPEDLRRGRQIENSEIVSYGNISLIYLGNMSM